MGGDPKVKRDFTKMVDMAVTDLGFMKRATQTDKNAAKRQRQKDRKRKSGKERAAALFVEAAEAIDATRASLAEAEAGVVEMSNEGGGA